MTEMLGKFYIASLTTASHFCRDAHSRKDDVLALIVYWRELR